MNVHLKNQGFAKTMQAEVQGTHVSTQYIYTYLYASFGNTVTQISLFSPLQYNQVNFLLHSALKMLNKFTNGEF